MNKIYHILNCFILVFSIQSCCKEENFPSSDILGEITVDLDANSSVLRTKETLIGNMICDGIKKEMDLRGETVDFVIMNGGAIRFDSDRHPNGIYPAGIFTSAMVDEMLPFENANVIVKVTGKELKSIFERSVALYPLTVSGPFLQVSKELTIIIDTTKTSQVIDDLVDPPVIVTPGNRIISIKINNVEYDSLATYTLVVNEFIAEQTDNDGYVAFRNILADKKENLGDSQAEAVKNYIKLNTPVTPQIEGRIIFQ
jgi:2',3'-cyclic-nucleotide 2'-phosphodiesterase (5'-nucleotidase family)